MYNKYNDFLDDGFVLTSTHEPLIFWRRTGRINVNSANDWEAFHSEESVKQLRAMGLSMLRLYFHKGFGFEIEQENREKARDYIKLCHKHGLKVQTYIAFQSAVSETTRAEAYDYDDWIMRDEHGQPLNLWFNHQNFRNLPCLNRDGFWENLKKATYASIVECRADAIGYDNVSWSVEPVVCLCDVCKKEFVLFIKSRYPTSADAIDRFGHDKLDNIEPPRWNYYANHLNLTEITQPVIQEWIEFKTATLHKRIKQMYDYCKSLNPDVLVEINACMQTGQNCAFHMGIYENDLSDGCDAFWNEVDPFPGYRDGKLLHKARVYKTIGAMGKIVFTGHGYGGVNPNANEYLLALSEGMAFQKGTINCIHLIDTYKVVKKENPLHMPLLNFSKANRKLYNAKPVAFAHIYESRSSLVYSNFESHYANILMNQVLLRQKIPYSVIHSLDNIDKCKVIILPGMSCLSMAEIDKIVAYVENGGGLVLTGKAGDYNENFRGLADKSLKARLGIAGETAPYAASFGKGRVVMYPRLSSAHDFDSYDWVYRPFEESQVRVKFESWEAPENMHQLAGSIKWAANYDLPVVVEAPEVLVCELTQDGDTKYLHLLNYAPNTPAKGVQVSFKEKIKSAALLSPITGESKELKVIDSHSIAVNTVEIYEILKVE